MLRSDCFLLDASPRRVSRQTITEQVQLATAYLSESYLQFTCMDLSRYVKNSSYDSIDDLPKNAEGAAAVAYEVKFENM
jgi:hypothetical protein